AQVLQYVEHVDVVLTEAHPEANIGHAQVLRHGMQLVVTCEVGRTLAHHGQIPLVLVLEHGVRLPLAVFPRPHGGGELAEVDFGIEVGGEIARVAARVDVDNIDGIDGVEIGDHAVAAVSVHHTRVKTHAQNGGHARCSAGVAALPLIVGVPGRRFANLVR